MHQEYVEDNFENRLVEADSTQRNIDFWKKNSLHIKSANAIEMKEGLRQSSSEAKMIYADEKKYRKYCLTEGSGALSRTLSLHTSSKVLVIALDTE